MVGLCGELAPRSLLLCRERFLRILFDRSDVNIASGKTQRVTITLARTAQMAACPEPPEHRYKKLFRFLRPIFIGAGEFRPILKAMDLGA
jgi:hypothetical protein